MPVENEQNVNAKLTRAEENTYVYILNIYIRIFAYTYICDK